MTFMPLERYAAQIIAQTDRLTERTKGADLALPVPTCPGWSLGDLLRHVGGAHRWAEEIVRTRATGPVSDDQVNDVSGDDRTDAAALADWLREGAALLAGALRDAGPDARVWTVAPNGTPLFWARRMMHESALHRADAAVAVGGTYTLDREVALDGLDEWRGFTELPQAYPSPEAVRALLAPGRTVRMEVSGADAAPGASWLVDLTGAAPVARDAEAAERAGEEAAVTVRGSAAALLLLMYQRQDVLDDAVEFTGDRELFARWREAVTHWLRKS
ncbi:maleylpyruvate isomerase N-terminal domain-containing protein [Streptomyces sp. NPDC017941]|uniref:maleylpyruvate isomerase N-terminal domain-containing protein n=1 Tax=Streptomyces sp. NPDC017941 TaxID=3365018 RepID=UPI0037B46AC4